MQQFQQKEGAYALIQGTRPHTLACGLNDPPAGLARVVYCVNDVEMKSTNARTRADS